jgi:hypothetical protein
MVSSFFTSTTISPLAEARFLVFAASNRVDLGAPLASMIVAM